MTEEATTQSSDAKPETSTESDAPLMGGAQKAAEQQEATKPADAKPPEEVKYEFKDLPEGYDATDITAFAKEHKISPEIARKLIDREVGAVGAFRKSIEDNFNQLTTKGWVAQLKADPEIGGKNWEASLAATRMANDKLPDAIKKEIDDNKLGNNPVIFKILNTFGKMLKEDKFVRGNTASEKPRSWHERIYAK